jgi:hypothetical protein
VLPAPLRCTFRALPAPLRCTFRVLPCAFRRRRAPDSAICANQ